MGGDENTEHRLMFASKKFVCEDPCVVAVNLDPEGCSFVVVVSFLVVVAFPVAQSRGSL